MVDNLELANFNKTVDFEESGAQTALLAEFKISLNAYLEELVVSPVRSLADVIAFNEKFSDLVSNTRLSLIRITQTNKISIFFLFFKWEWCRRC